jgi:expansin (peptidoglycan-binding protein)
MVNRKKVFSAILIIVVQALVVSGISSAKSLVGDVNGDNNINSFDYALMRSFLLGKIDDFPVQDGMWSADTNGDEEINSIDFGLIRKYILGMIDVFPKTVSPTSTQIISPTPISTPTPTITSEASPNTEPYPGWDRVRTGYATYTETGYVGGIALLDPIPEDMEIVAVNKPDLNSYGVQSALAGAYIEITGPKGTTVAYVTDCYTEALEGALDLCGISCDKIGDKNVLGGRIPLTWRVIEAPITGNFTYRIIPASSKWWLALQIRNHKYPVMKLEYFNDGEWIDVEKDRCNYFAIRNLTSNTLKIRVTDIRGKVVTDVIEIPEDTEDGCFIPGNVQFPEE